MVRTFGRNMVRVFGGHMVGMQWAYAGHVVRSFGGHTHRLLVVIWWACSGHMVGM